MNKRRARQGFTLTELLVSTLVMLLGTAVIVAAVNLAMRNYNARNRDAEAQILCSNLAVCLQDELTYAGSVREEGGVVTFTSHARQSGPCRFMVLDRDGGTYSELTGGASGRIDLRRVREDMAAYSPDYDLPLADDAFYDVSGERLTAGLSLTWIGEDAAAHAGQFHVVVTVYGDDGGELAGYDFYVRPVSP